MQSPLQAAGRTSRPPLRTPKGERDDACRTAAKKESREAEPPCLQSGLDQLLAVKPRPTTSLVSMTEMMAWGSCCRTIRRMVATSTVLAMI